MSNLSRPKSTGDKLTAREINEDLPIELTAGEAIASTPVAVYIKDSDGLCYKTDADFNDERIHNFAGFAMDESGESGSPVTVQTHGKVSGFTGLNTGKPYYLSTTAGDISVSTPAAYSKMVGVAVSSTELLILHLGINEGPQTFKEVKTFGSIPVLPASNPTTANQAMRRAYIDYVVGDILKSSADTERTGPGSSYTLRKQITIDRGGALRISFAIYGDDPDATFARIYRNGSPVGTERSKVENAYETFSEDISGWSEGDKVEIYWKAVTGTTQNKLKEFRIYTDNWITLSVDLD